MGRTVLLAAAALLAAPAAAQERACRDVQALLNVNGGNFRDVAWTMEAGIGTFATVRGRRVALPAAESCDLSVDANWTQFHCRWEFAASAEAGAGYDRLIARINQCLARPLRAGLASGGQAVRIAQKHERSFVSRGRETDVGLTLFEHLETAGDAGQSGPPRLYVVELAVALDTGRIVPPDEVDEDE